MKHCPKCSSQNKLGARFCSKCGTALLSNEIPKQKPTQEPPTIIPASPPNSKSNVEKSKGIWRKVWFFGVLGAFGCCLGELLTVVEFITVKHFDSIFLGIWMFLLALGMTFALVLGQNRYLRRRLFTQRQIIVCIAGSLIAGLFARVIAQEKYFFNYFTDFVGPGLVWGLLLGAFIGGEMAFSVPNLKAWKAIAGGLIGGTVGSLGLLWVGATFHNWVAGWLIGGAILGFFIGSMVALAEIAFREAWLEIRYGPKEIRTVSLGVEPVSIGSDQGSCTVYARNAPPVAYRYRLDQGRILCQEGASGHFMSVQPGDSKLVGIIVVTVCTSRKKANPVTQVA